MESVRLPNTRSWRDGAGPRFLLRWIGGRMRKFRGDSPLKREERRGRQNRPRLRPAPIMRQPRRTRARRPDFGDLHAGNLLLGSNNELLAIGRLDKRFLPRAGRYKFESQEFRTRPIPSDTIKGPIQLSNACRTQRSRFDQQPSNRLKHLWQNFSR